MVYDEREGTQPQLPAIPSREVAEYTVPEVVAQVRKIQEIMSAVMKKDEHYGVIPGTDKPSLYKPGAEKLNLTFRFRPEYKILPESVLQRDFINYRIRCHLIHIITGRDMGTGMGSCNSLEIKYRYRWVAGDRPLGQDPKKLTALGLGKWRKRGGKWIWFNRAENDNPSDLDNTLFKMGCKRALIAAVLNALAASDIFTQDLEDSVEDDENENGGEGPGDGGVQEPQSKAEAAGGTAPTPEAPTQGPGATQAAQTKEESRDGGDRAAPPPPQAADTGKPPEEKKESSGAPPTGTGIEGPANQYKLKKVLEILAKHDLKATMLPEGLREGEAIAIINAAKDKGKIEKILASIKKHEDAKPGN